MEGRESQHVIQGASPGGEFESEGVKVCLRITDEGLSWTANHGPGREKEIIQWRDIIRCHKGKVDGKHTLDVPGDAENSPSFTVHYTQRGKKHTWRHGHKVFTCRDHTFNNIVSTISHRSKQDHPRRLMVLINPDGGTGKGEMLYRKLVAPLFKLAQIDTDVIVSDHPKDAEEIGETYDFTAVDGVVITGGNGTFQRLIHTLLPRIQREAGVDMSDPTHKLKPIPCPIGMLPTGTENGLAKGEYDTADVTTAALQIITGRRIIKHLASISSCGSHIGFSGMVVGSGSWCDMLDGDHDYRWLGVLRYPILASKLLLHKRRDIHIKLQYLPFVQPKEGHPPDHSPSPLEWESVDGHFTGVVSFPGLMLLDDTSDEVHVDHNHAGMTLCLEKQCGQLKYFNWLFKLQTLSKDMFDADFITAKRVTAYKLKIVPRQPTEGEEHLELEERGRDNRCRSDGELLTLEKPEISVRILPKVLEMYGTGWP